MISPKDMIDRIQESYAEGRDRERAAVLKQIDREIADYRTSRGDFTGHIDALQSIRSTIENGEHAP